MELILKVLVKNNFSTCMKMYVLIRGGLITVKLLFVVVVVFTEITHVCVEECLFIQSLYFPSVIF